MREKFTVLFMPNIWYKGNSFPFSDGWIYRLAIAQNNQEI
jgi:hypothetical protein